MSDAAGALLAGVDWAAVAILTPLVGGAAAFVLPNRARAIGVAASGATAAAAVALVWLIATGTAGYLAFGPIGLILAVGTVEIAAQLYFWLMLGRAGLLSIREEALLIATALAGAAIGKGVAMVAMTFIH